MRGKHNGWLAGALLVGVACLVGSLWLFSGGGAEPAGRPAEAGTERTGSGTRADARREKAEGVVVTVLYDNNEYDKRLQTAWGFSCLVEGLEKTILFDTGGDSSMLLSNMRKLGIDPKIVDVIVISHIHADHLGGLAGFLGVNHDVVVFLPASFPGSVRQTVKNSGATLVNVGKSVQICENAYSTGELGTWIKEQSLVIQTDRGLVVITGCAHPGVVTVVKQAKEMLKDRVHLVLGGFHLCWLNRFQIKSIVEGVRKEGVKMVGPCHCSGGAARSTFEEAYGKNFILVGAGKRIHIGAQ